MLLLETGSQSWKQDLASAYGSVADLVTAGLLTPVEADSLRGEPSQIRVTRHYAGLMQPEHPHCPIRLQGIPGLLGLEDDPVLPDWAREASLRIYGREAPWHADAIGDVRNLAEPRLTHRYGNRAILHVSSACAVYCRFCFRKSHLSAREQALYSGPWDAAFRYLAEHSEIRELILTGGDPLSLTDEALERLLERAAAVPNLRVLRLHSRMAVTLPSRLDSGLARVLGRSWPFRLALVSHFNHPRELAPASVEGLQRLARTGVGLYNQSVLLRRVNNSVGVLAELFQSLYEVGVTPFYLHHPDWTPNTFGFRVSIEEGRSLMRELRGRVSGPALPEYVLDVPGGEGKIPLLDSAVVRTQSYREGAIYGLPGAETRRRAGGRPLEYLDLYPTV